MLFVNDDPIRAYDIAQGIINVIGRDTRMPDVRVGLATGSVVMRLGDVFGPPVNLAARLTAVARRNRVIIDAATARAAARATSSRPGRCRPARCAGFGDRRAGRRTPALSASGAPSPIPADQLGARPGRSHSPYGSYP